MATGRTHNIISACTGAVVLGLSWKLWGNPNVFATLGCLAGILIMPDLDLSDEYRINSIKIISGKFPVFARLWRLFWKPYAIIIPHRSLWSHAPVLGTIIRLLYIGIVPTLISALLNMMLYRDIMMVARAYWIWLINLILNPSFLNFFAGLCLVDTLHVIFDFNRRQHEYRYNSSGQRHEARH